jgi:hypothetical protein
MSQKDRIHSYINGIVSFHLFLVGVLIKDYFFLKGMNDGFFGELQLSACRWNISLLNIRSNFGAALIDVSPWQPSRTTSKSESSSPNLSCLVLDELAS